MPLHNRRVIVKSEIVEQRVECHGHHDALLVVRFVVEWSDGRREIREWSMPMVGSVVVGEERVEEIRQ